MAGLLAASSLIHPVDVYAKDYTKFEENQDYYWSYCTNINLSEEDEKLCDEFADFLNERKEQLKQELDEINNNLANIKKDISLLQTKLNSIASQIRKKTEQIQATEVAIQKVESNIAVLEKQIADREADIEARDQMIRKRLDSVQSIMRVNAFADFIMGAKNFVDLIRRVEGVNDITSYDKKQIQELQEQKALLIEDKEELDDQKQKLEKQKASLQEAKNNLIATQKTQQELLAEYNYKMSEFEAQANQKCENIDEVQKALKDVSNIRNLKPSAGWVMPVKSASVSAGAFYYPASFCSAGANKCPHLGTDFAANVGTPIYAPANSVVLYVNDNCPTYGGLGNYCGKPGSAGGGNQVYLAMVVNGKTYAAKLLHMKSGSIKASITWPSADGKAVIVQQGQKIGEVGSSGNSSGPHLHIEIFYFGTKNLTELVQEFAADPKFDFGLGFSSAGLSTTCNRTKYKAPCRYNPSEIFNVSLGQSW